MSPPAVAKGTLYTAREALEVRALATGSVTWSAALPPMLPDAMTGDRALIVTNNLAFVASSDDVFAIDLASRAVVWTFPVGGQLSISASGILYVKSVTGIYAVNLL